MFWVRSIGLSKNSFQVSWKWLQDVTHVNAVCAVLVYKWVSTICTRQFAEVLLAGGTAATISLPHAEKIDHKIANEKLVFLASPKKQWWEAGFPETASPKKQRWEAGFPETAKSHDHKKPASQKWHVPRSHDQKLAFQKQQEAMLNNHTNKQTNPHTQKTWLMKCVLVLSYTCWGAFKYP